MSTRLRALRGRMAAEDGVTLVELMVTIMLIGLVGALVLASLLAMGRAVAVADATSFDQGFARNAVTLMSRDIRAAAAIQQSPDPAFIAAGPRGARFTANLSTGQRSTLVEIRVDADGRLVVTSTQSDPASVAPDLVFDPATTVDRYIAPDVVTTGPILEYFDETGAALDQFVDGGSLTSADRARIATVRMTLDVNRSPLQSRPTQATTTVRLPNGGANR